MVDKRLIWAQILGYGIIAATIIEDIITLGEGISDDAASFAAAGYLAALALGI